MKQAVIVVPYDDRWPHEFRHIGGKLRRYLGEQALRIDHIGSTAVPGLDAKPAINIQVSVLRLEPMTYKAAMEAAGYRQCADNEDASKRYCRELESARRTHIHVKEKGSWSEQFALLFRDFLRTNETYRQLYAGEKRNLAQRFMLPHERDLYVEGKTPIVWRIMQEASAWSQRIGWRAEGSDS